MSDDTIEACECFLLSRPDLLDRYEVPDEYRSEGMLIEMVVLRPPWPAGQWIVRLRNLVDVDVRLPGTEAGGETGCICDPMSCDLYLMEMRYSERKATQSS